VAGGRVHVNGERAKAAKLVRVGDVLRVSKGTERWTVRVEQLAERRGSASAAQALYTEAEDSRTAREQDALVRRFARALGSDLGARPTKQARRKLDALRRRAR
jgi:ribosome-associated heat shock protein Hsp15